MVAGLWQYTAAAPQGILQFRAFFPKPHTFSLCVAAVNLYFTPKIRQLTVVKPAKPFAGHVI
jgi:hypothetical protein